MPKGLIPLIAGLGAAGTMVGISIPSAVTVIPKKDKSPEYTGWVFDHKIYKTELEAKQALVTSLNTIGPKELGTIHYTVAGASAAQTESFQSIATKPTTSNLAAQYSYGNMQTIKQGEVNSTVEFGTSSTEATFSDFKFSLNSIDAAPQATLSNVDIGTYASTLPSIQWSGGKVFSTKNNKFYWFADIEHESGITFHPSDSTHSTQWTDSVITDDMIQWGEAGDPTNTNSANFAFKFHNDARQPVGTVVYLYTTKTLSDITSTSAHFVNNLITYSAFKKGTPGTDMDQYDLLKGSTKLGVKIVANGAVAPTITATDITITNTVNPVLWDTTNLTPAKLSQIIKVSSKSQIVSGTTWVSSYSMITTPTSIYKEVNNG